MTNLSPKEVPAHCKPFIRFTIDRHGDAAMVTIHRTWFEGEETWNQVLEQYETASSGATASARKSAAKFRPR
jgi:hypothetical protein